MGYFYTRTVIAMRESCLAVVSSEDYFMICLSNTDSGRERNVFPSRSSTAQLLVTTWWQSETSSRWRWSSVRVRPSWGPTPSLSSFTVWPASQTLKVIKCQDWNFSKIKYFLGNGGESCAKCSYPLCAQDCPQLSLHRVECEVFVNADWKFQDLSSLAPITAIRLEAVAIFVQ